MIQSDNMSKTRDKDIRKIFILTYTSVRNLNPSIYSMQQSDVATEKLSSIGSFGQIGEFTGKVDYFDIEEEDEMSKSHVEYVGGMQLQRKAIDDDQHRVIAGLPKMLGEAMAYRRQQDGASLFNNAFSTNYMYLDGLSLCNSTHDQASTATTISNTGTTAFSPAGVKATRLAMRKVTDASDNIISIIPNLVIGPIDKQDAMEEVFGTDKDVYGANNTKNVLYNAGISFLNWEFLTSTTAWFMAAKALMSDNVVWFNRKNTEFNKENDIDTYIERYTSYMRYVPTAVDYRWVYGQNATT